MKIWEWLFTHVSIIKYADRQTHDIQATFCIMITCISPLIMQDSMSD
jgi:hypothetical protein